MPWWGRTVAKVTSQFARVYAHCTLCLGCASDSGKAAPICNFVRSFALRRRALSGWVVRRRVVKVSGGWVEEKGGVRYTQAPCFSQWPSGVFLPDTAWLGAWGPWGGGKSMRWNNGTVQCPTWLTGRFLPESLVRSIQDDLKKELPRVWNALLPSKWTRICRSSKVK